MTARKRNWLIAISLIAAAVVTGFVVTASILRSRIDPYVRQQVVDYLSKRFDSDVELKSLHIGVPRLSMPRLVLMRGRGIIITVQGTGLALHSKLRQDLDPNGAPLPLFSIQKFGCEIPLESIFGTPKLVNHVTVEGMDIRIPPRGERPSLSNKKQPERADSQEKPSDSGQDNPKPGVLIRAIDIQRASLTMLPRDRRKTPLVFDIQHVSLESVGPNRSMKYQATLINPKPPGKIQSSGTFGPWAADDPSETPLAGEYRFDNADLGVFNAIAGTLHSTGTFEGKLSAITARGEASAPNFRLKRSDNPVPLTTRFEVLVDGSNGNTILKPVVAKLGSTNFTTSGGIIRHEAGQRRAISLDVSMPDGNMRDVLRLAMRGDPFMEGRLTLKTKIDVPPLSGKVREKLKLDGRFEINDGKILRSTMQKQLDGLSRRAQGRPDDHEVDQVVSKMMGDFKLDNEVITFSQLSFGIPGARLNMKGSYNLDADQVAFTGTARLRATVSEMVTGWKHWVLKPVDKLFEKNGAGTFLHFHVDGTAAHPKFGLDLMKR